MREMEFLPDWYRTLNRRRRWVMIQMWLTFAVIIVLALHMGLGARNVLADQSSLKTLQSQVVQTEAQLQQLHDWQAARKQLSRQAQIVAKLGPHVPTAKILDTLDEMMPPQMGLLDLSMDDVQIGTKPVGGLAAAGSAEPLIDHQLKVKLHGVAPTGIEVGNFLAKLASVPYFSNIEPTFSKDRQDQLAAGHTMREFEVTFTIDLNPSH